MLNPIMQISNNGLNIIKDFEKLRLTVYYDEGGLGTIGWGHLVKNGENYTTIDLATANQILLEDVKIAVDAINSLVDTSLNQNQFDALVSLCFNIGETAFAESTLLTLLTCDNVPCYAAAAQQFMRWVYVDGQLSDGLSNRRKREQSLFLTECNNAG